LKILKDIARSSEMAPKEEWDKLKAEILKKTEEIDKKTPWLGEREPEWWLQMKKVQRVVLGYDV
jgi:hypothetical protein